MKKPIALVNLDTGRIFSKRFERALLELAAYRASSFIDEEEDAYFSSLISTVEGPVKRFIKLLVAADLLNIMIDPDALLAEVQPHALPNEASSKLYRTYGFKVSDAAFEGPWVHLETGEANSWSPVRPKAAK